MPGFVLHGATTRGTRDSGLGTRGAAHSATGGRRETRPPDGDRDTAPYEGRPILGFIVLFFSSRFASFSVSLVFARSGSPHTTSIRGIARARLVPSWPIFLFWAVWTSSAWTDCGVCGFEIPPAAATTQRQTHQYWPNPCKRQRPWLAEMRPWPCAAAVFFHCPADVELAPACGLLSLESSVF